MDSPESNQVVVSTSTSPAVQDSPFSSFLSNLSPIKPDKALHVAQGFPELSFPPPPPVFTSPRINPQRETSFLKRSQCPGSSSAGLSLEHDNRGKIFAAGSDFSGPSITQSIVGLIPCSQKECPSKGSVQVQPCSPSQCVDEYLVDHVEVEDCVNTDSADLLLKQANGATQALQSGCTSSKETIVKLDDDDRRKDTGIEVAAPLTSLEQAEEDLLGKSLFHVKSVEPEGEQKDSERPTDKCSDVMPEKVNDLVPSNLSLEPAPGAQHCQHVAAQNVALDSFSIMTKKGEQDNAEFDKERSTCSRSLRSHGSQDVKLQNAEGGQQGEWDCTPQLLPEPLQIVHPYENCGENSGAISDGSLENKMPYDFEEAGQHQRVTRRRCLQFEAAEACRDSSSWNPTDIIPNSRLPANPTELEILDSSHLESSVTSNNRQPVHFSQPVTYGLSLCPLKTPETCIEKIDRSVRSGRNSSITAPMPSGIGLHLNSIVNAAAMGCSAAASMKLAEKDYPSAQREKSPSVIEQHLPEDTKTSSLPASEVGKFAANTSDDQHESLAIASSTTFHSSHGKKPQDNTLQLKLIEHQTTPCDKRKFALENADKFEESDQLGPKKKRKKTSYTIENDGCKRCNCKRSKCLKLYCECFAAGVYCAEPCTCQDCFNKPEYEDTVLGTRQQIESRNPLAFAPKIVRRVTESPANSGEDGNRMTPSSARHKRGCNCKKSMCLKKYCECYQAGVGCSDGCRCEGCKNIFGIKEGYGEITEMVYRRADDGWEDLSDEKLEMAETRSDFLQLDQCHPHNLSPLTPSFQYSNHGKDMPKSRLPAGRYLQSPESDIIISSPHGTSTGFFRNLNSHDMQGKTGEGCMDIVPYDPQLQCSMEGRVDQLSSRQDGLSDICDITPLPHSPSRVTASSSSSNTRDCTTVSRAQFCHGSVCLSSVGSLRWRGSPITPLPRLGGSKLPPEPDSDSGLYEVLEDDTPEILKDTPTPIKAIKASSPNQKRVSPPHSRLHEVRSSSSPGLRSGRKFVLQSISSFPPLTPYSDPKGSTSSDK